MYGVCVYGYGQPFFTYAVRAAHYLRCCIGVWCQLHHVLAQEADVGVAFTRMPLYDEYGWPEPYIYTVYDRIFDDFPARNTVYTP